VRYFGINTPERGQSDYQAAPEANRARPERWADLSRGGYGSSWSMCSVWRI